MEKISVKEILEITSGKLLYGSMETAISGASTNSRQINEGDLFVPIIGERVDGHRFISQALESGASVSLTSIHDVGEELPGKEFDGKCLIKVNDTLRAFQTVAAYARNKFEGTLVGITGSVGKTTTKEMVAAALEARYNVLKTEGNLNSQIGLSLMMMRFEKTHEAAVIEMGVSENGEMPKLCDISRPKYAVMTNIGMSHINQFKNRENTRREKLNIINHFDEDSILFVNGDDELLYQVALCKMGRADILMDECTRRALEKCRVITFGVGEQCEYRALNVDMRDTHTAFTMVHNDKKTDVNLVVPGMHNVTNALAALAVADNLGVNPEDAAKKLSLYQPIAMRGTIIKNEKFTIIDDTYNASPDSIKSGIDVLAGMRDAVRTFAVLADVLELGEASYQCHYDVGEYLASSPVDELVTVGTEAKIIAKAVSEKAPKKVVHSFDNNNDAIEYLKASVSDGSVLLIKGSRGMHMDEIVKALS